MRLFRVCSAFLNSLSIIDKCDLVDCNIIELWTAHYQLHEFCVTILLLLPAWLGCNSFVNTNFTELIIEITKFIMIELALIKGSKWWSVGLPIAD